MARLIAQAPMDVSGRSYKPGEVLPELMHSWPLLADTVRRGAIWVDGEPHATLVDSRTGHPLNPEISPDLLLGMVRRGQVKSTSGDTPEMVAAAAQQVFRRFDKPTYPGPAPAPAVKSAPLKNEASRSHRR